MGLSEGIANLKKFLNASQSNKSALAYRLGLKSTTTIDQWIVRKRIPPGKLSDVMRLMRAIKKAL